MSKTVQKPKRRTDAGKVMFVFINVMIWIIILCYPFMLATRDGSFVQLDKYIIYSWIPVMFMLVFYFNYYFLIDKLIFEKRQWLIFLLCNFVLIVVVAGCSQILQEIYLTRFVSDTAQPRERITLATYVIRDGLVLMLVIGLSVALKMAMAWQGHETERAKLESEKRDAELQNLRSQLNPHFLFNTLNNIYSLTVTNPEKAREAIHSLSSIMRYILYNNESHVPLDKELEFVRSYIELMKLRQTGNMTIEADLPAGGQGLMIAPLMFMTLIENGFKHGVSQTEPSFVRIAVSVSESKKGKKSVTCRVENSFFPKTDSDRSGSGIGVGNLRRRLALLYPRQNSLRLEREENTHIAELTIKLM